jgi:hypothetical protein
MGLAEAFAAPQPAPSKTLKIDKILAGLDKEDAVALRAALLSPEFQHAYIARLLTEHGHEVSEKSVASWRSASRRHSG